MTSFANPSPCLCGHGPSRHYWPIDRDLTACRVRGCQCDNLRLVVPECDDCGASLMRLRTPEGIEDINLDGSPHDCTVPEGERPMETTRVPFGPEDLKIRSREEFVGNECDTDQYRETQPMSGLSRAADLLEYLYGASDQRFQYAWALVQKWVDAAGHNYEGCDEAVPLYELIHDVLWEQGKHPYYGDLQELTDWFTEMDAEDGNSIMAEYRAAGAAELY